MGAAKLLWEISNERIEDDYVAGNLTRDEAVDALMRQGFDRAEANDMLEPK